MTMYSYLHCLNINLDSKKANVYDFASKQFIEIGSEGYEKIFQEKIDKFSVELDYEQEVTLFLLKRNEDGDWIALKDSYSFFIGKPKNITYDKLIEVDNYFLEQKESNKMESNLK